MVLRLLDVRRVLLTLKNVKTKIGDFQHPSGVDDAVGGFEVAVGFEVGAVKVVHSLGDVVEKRETEQTVQFDVRVLEDVLQTSCIIKAMK